MRKNKHRPDTDCDLHNTCRLSSRILQITFKPPTIAPASAQEEEEFEELFRNVTKASQSLIQLLPVIIKRFLNASSDDRQDFKKMIASSSMHDRVKTAYGKLAYIVTLVIIFYLNYDLTNYKAIYTSKSQF